jgi:DNA-binding CsgD family transcriptional regulator
VLAGDPDLADLRLKSLSNQVYWLELLDRHAEADTAIQETLTLAERIGTHRLKLIHVAAGEHYFVTGQAAAVLAVCLDPGITGITEMPDRWRLLPTLTRLALAAGDTGSLLAAASYYQATGRPLDRAQALEDAAVLLTGGGDLAAARDAFATAVALYRGLGAEWDARRAGARLRPAGLRPGRRRRASFGWESLTPAETKIVALVAEGRSNPDIAEQLFLSRNTVQTHVSHVLAKLDARSRGEIIREAIRRMPAEQVG